MSTNFQTIPIRPNSGIITAAWWNSLRVAGMAVESAVNAVQASLVGGGGTTAEQSQALSSGATSANITGLLLSNTYHKYEMRYWARYTNGTTNLMEVGTILFWWNGSAWQFGYGARLGDTFLVLDVDDVSGQVHYSTAALAGLDTTNSKLGYSLTTQG